MEVEAPIATCLFVPLPSKSFTVCGKVSWFVHVTVVPALTSMTAGAYFRLFGISTLSVLTGVPGTSNFAEPEEQAARPTQTRVAIASSPGLMPAPGRGLPGFFLMIRRPPRG